MDVRLQAVTVTDCYTSFKSTNKVCYHCINSTNVCYIS